MSSTTSSLAHSDSNLETRARNRAQRGVETSASLTSVRELLVAAGATDGGRGPRAGDAPAARVAVFVIRSYRIAVSPWLGAHCRFVPSCSTYAAEAIARHGVLAGVWLAIRRLLRCHPFHEGGFDPVG